METKPESEDERALEFEDRAAARGGSGPLGEFWYFLRRTRNWWLAPIILLLVMIGGLLVLSGTAIAPLIYALF